MRLLRRILLLIAALRISESFVYRSCVAKTRCWASKEKFQVGVTGRDEVSFGAVAKESNGQLQSDVIDSDDVQRKLDQLARVEENLLRERQILMSKAQSEQGGENASSLSTQRVQELEQQAFDIFTDLAVFGISSSAASVLLARRNEAREKERRAIIEEKIRELEYQNVLKSRGDQRSARTLSFTSGIAAVALVLLIKSFHLDLPSLPSFLPAATPVISSVTESPPSLFDDRTDGSSSDDTFSSVSPLPISPPDDYNMEVPDSRPERDDESAQLGDDSSESMDLSYEMISDSKFVPPPIKFDTSTASAIGLVGLVGTGIAAFLDRDKGKEKLVDAFDTMGTESDDSRSEIESNQTRGEGDGDQEQRETSRSFVKKHSSPSRGHATSSIDHVSFNEDSSSIESWTTTGQLYHSTGDRKGLRVEINDENVSIDHFGDFDIYEESSNFDYREDLSDDGLHHAEWSHTTESSFFTWNDPHVSEETDMISHQAEHVDHVSDYKYDQELIEDSLIPADDEELFRDSSESTDDEAIVQYSLESSDDEELVLDSTQDREESVFHSESMQGDSATNDDESAFEEVSTRDGLDDVKEAPVVPDEPPKLQAPTIRLSQTQRRLEPTSFTDNFIGRGLRYLDPDRRLETPPSTPARPIADSVKPKKEVFPDILNAKKRNKGDNSKM